MARSIKIGVSTNHSHKWLHLHHHGSRSKTPATRLRRPPETFRSTLALPHQNPPPTKPLLRHPIPLPRHQPPRRPPPPLLRPRLTFRPLPQIQTHHLHRNQPHPGGGRAPRTLRRPRLRRRAMAVLDNRRRFRDLEESEGGIWG